MWKAIIGKSFERSEQTTSQSSRRKDEVDKTASRHRSPESIVSSNSARKPTRGEDRDRGFNPSSTSYSSTSRTAYPGTAPASVASSYATASSNQADQPFTPPGLVRNASLADRMPKPRGSRDERRRDSDRGQRGERRERSTSRERRSNHRDRSRSRDREDKRRGTRRTHDEQQPDRDLARGLSRSVDDYIDDQSNTRAGDYSVHASGNFGAQVGSSGFTQFPGQYDGGLPGSFPEPSPALVHMSSHVPDQFPGQFPSQAAAPYRPPLGPGLAAEYYGDTGESVAHQPGVRPQAPTLIVGAEPHLQAASPIAAPPPEPSATGNVGAAASFFGGADDYEPRPSSKPPKPGKQSKPDIPGNPYRPSGAAVVAGSAALGFAAASSGTSTAPAGPGGTSNSSFVPESSYIPARPTAGYPPSTTGQGTSHHSSSMPVIPTLGAAAAGAAAGYVISHHSSSQQSRPSVTSSSGNAGIYVSSTSQRPQSQRPESQRPYSPAHATYIPMGSNGRPGRPGKHSSQSNVPLYAAGLAGTAGVAAAAYQSNHSHSHNSNTHPYSQPYASGSMAQRHRHRGPLSKLVDFLKDPDGVAEFEEYTEYIGVCKYCFPPGSSPRDAPRKHNYRRRGSNERYGSSTRIDKDSRYWSSDGESRRKKGRSWLATGMAGYGLAKIGKSLSRAPENDFRDYSVRSGRLNHSSSSLAGRNFEHSSDRRYHTSHGVALRSSDTGSRHRSRSREGIETGVTSEGKLYKKDRHGSFFGGPSMKTYEARRRHSRSRSSSRDRRNGATSAAMGAIIGSSMATSTLRHRSRSPEMAFARPKRRSREHSPSSGSKHGKGASYSTHGGPFASSSPYVDGSRSHIKPSNTVSAGFFSSRTENSSRHKKKSKGFFSFSNSSSSSSDVGLAYGSAFERRKSSKQSVVKRNDARNTNAAILGLGAAAAALAATDLGDARQRRRRPDLVAVKEHRSKHGRSPERSRPSRRSSMSSNSEDGAWEDASEDDESSSISSGLAYGGAARKSQDSLISEASGTSKWGWRWGSSKKKKDSGRPVSNIGGTVTQTSAAIGGLGAYVTGESPASDNRRDDAMSSVGSLPSMQHVHPIPTSDPSRFDISRQSSTMSSNLPMVTSRPAPIPLQQPQPIAPVSSAVYTSQAPYAHSYSAPTGPPVFSGVASHTRPTVTDVQQARMIVSPDKTIPGSFPHQESELERLPREESPGQPRRRRDSSPFARTEVVEPSSSARRKRASTQGQGSSVRFDVAKEQTDKERRNQRRQEEDDDELNRQRLLLRAEQDRKDREKQRRRRLKEEEDDQRERFRLEERKKQSERDYRDKRRTLEKENSTQEHAFLRKSDDHAEMGGERQGMEFGPSNESLLRSKGNKTSRSEYEPPNDHEGVPEEVENLASWAAPGIIGAAGAVIVASAAEKMASSAKDSQAKRRNEQRTTRDDAANGIGNMRSSKRQSPSQDSDDLRDREAQVTRKVAPEAAPGPRHEDYATYFAPTELLGRSRNQQQVFDPAGNDEGVSYHTPHIITIEPGGRKSPSYSPADAFNEVAYERPIRNPAVPALNVIEPTPPHSIAGSSRGDASPIWRPEDATSAEINEPEKTSTPSKVTWGEPETVEYTVITPLESRDEFISNTDTPPALEEVIQVVTIAPGVAPAMAVADVRAPILPVDEVIARHMPGEFGDDLEFAATLAAGLQDTGFDPAIVIDDPTYRRRDSPPGSESNRFYRQPFFETVTDLGLDSPGTEGAPPQRGFIEGELPSTPKDEQDFDISSKKQVNKKEKRKKDKGANRRETDDFYTTGGSSLSKSSTMDEILKEPDKYSEEPEAMVSLRSGPNDVLNRPAKSSRPESDQLRERSEVVQSTGARPVSRSRTDPQGYFDDPQTAPRSPIHTTQQDARIMDFAASIPLPEDRSDDPSLIKGPSVDDSRYTQARTTKAETPISRREIATTRSPDAEGIAPDSVSDLAHKTEGFDPRTEDRGSSQDDSPTKYVESSTRFLPDTQEVEEPGKRKKKSKRASVPDDLSDGEPRSVAAPATEPDEYQKPRKGKKKSKRDSVDYEDAASAVTAPAAFDIDKTSKSNRKRDKKGGLFGLFSSNKSFEDVPEGGSAYSEATAEDFEKPKKTKRKSKDKSSSGDVYDMYGAAAQSVGDLSQIGRPREDSNDRKSQRSRDKDERRRSRKESTIESGITTQELPIKDEDRTSPTEEARRSHHPDNRTMPAGESQDNMESFLEGGNDIPSVPDGVEPVLSRQIEDDVLSQASDAAVQFRTPFSETTDPATIRTPSPQKSDRAANATKSMQEPPVSPSSAPASQEHRLSGLQFSDHTPISPAVPSPTAIPIHFRTPRPSAGFVRSSSMVSPGVAPDSPSSVVPRPRHARPGSTEFRPLWLVERHKSREQFDPKESYPSLPSSKTTSRSSSIHDPEDLYANDEIIAGPGNDTVLGVDVDRSLEPQEFLDSQQPTPVATRFPLAVQHDEDSQEKPHKPTDTEYELHAHVDTPDNLMSTPSLPSSRSLSGTKVLPAQFEDLQNLPPLSPSSDSSNHGDDELLSSSAIKDAAVAMGTLAADAATAVLGHDRSNEQTPVGSDPSDHIRRAKEIGRPLDTAQSQQKDVDPEMEPDLPPADIQSIGPYWQAGSSTTSPPEHGATVGDGLTDRVTPSQAAILISPEQQRELQEQDAQDAVDSWFAPPTPKKAKLEKQSKKQRKSSILKNNSVPEALPSPSASSSALAEATPLVAFEAPTENQHELTLPEGLTGSQSGQKAPRSTPVPPLPHELEQDESKSQGPPTLQPVEDDDEWPDRNRKSKKGKGKKRDNKPPKMPSKTVKAVPSNTEQEPQLVPEFSTDQDLAYSKIMEGAEDDRLGKDTRAPEEAENPDVTPKDEPLSPLPSTILLEPENISEYLVSSKKSKKDKKKAKQARQAEPALELEAKDSSSAADIDPVDDVSELVPTTSRSRDLESEATPLVSSIGHVTETPSDAVLAPELLIPAKRKGKAKKKQKLDLRPERDLSFDDSTSVAEEDTPRQQGVELASTTLERSIPASPMHQPRPVLEPESELEKVKDTTTVSSAAPDEPAQQGLDSGHAFAIPAKEKMRSSVQESSPLISAYPPPDDAPSPFPHDPELPLPLSPDMIPLPEDEESGIYDVPTDEELPREAEISHVIPGLEVEEKDRLQENNRSPALKPVSVAPCGFLLEQHPSAQLPPELIPMPSDKDGELDPYPAPKPSDETPGGFPTGETPSVLEVPRMVPLPLPSDKDVGLDRLPALTPLDEAPGAFPSEATRPVRQVSEMVPLPPHEDIGIDPFPAPEPLDEAPGAFPTKEMPLVQDAPEMIPLPQEEDVGLDLYHSIEVLDEAPGAFPTRELPSVQGPSEIISSPRDEDVENGSARTLVPPSETPGTVPTEHNPSAQIPVPLIEDVKLDRSATSKPLSETPGAFPTGQSPSVQAAPERVPLPHDESIDLYNPEADDDLPVSTKDYDRGTRRTSSTSMIATPAVQVPGAFRAGQSTLVRDLPEDVPSPPNATMDRDQHDNIQSPVHTSAGIDDYINGMRRPPSSSELASPAVELPGAFPARQSTPVQDLTGEVPSPRNARVVLRHQQDDPQLSEYSGADSMNQRELPTPAVELPGAFPVEVSPKDIPLPPDEDIDVYSPLEYDQYFAAPAVEFPGAFPGDLSLTKIPSTEMVPLPKNSKERSRSTMNDEQGQENALADDVQRDLPAAVLSPAKKMLSKTNILPVLKNLVPGVSISSETEQSSSVSPESIPLPDIPDVDLEETPSDNQALMGLTYDGGVVPITTAGTTSSKTVDLPDSTDYRSLSPNLVPLSYNTNLDLQEPSLGAVPLPIADVMSVETDPSLEGPIPIPTESGREAREHAVNRPGKEKPLSEPAEEVAGNEFFVPSRKKGKKAKKQQSAFNYIEENIPDADVTEEVPAVREVDLQAQPQDTAAEISKPSDVFAGRVHVDDQVERLEASAGPDTKNPFGAEIQRSTKKGKKNKKNNHLPFFEGQTTLTTPSSPGILSEIPREPELSAIEFPESVPMLQPVGETSREVPSDISTPSEGPFGRPLDVSKGLLGMSSKQKKKKGKKDMFLQDPESSSAVSEELTASAESNPPPFEKDYVFEEDEGFATKQSKKSKKARKKGKMDTSEATEDYTVHAVNTDSPATPGSVVVEDSTLAKAQRPITAVEEPKLQPDEATETPFKDSVQETISTPPLDSVVLAEPGVGDVIVELGPRNSDADYLYEAVASQLPKDDPTDFPVEVKDAEPEVEPYEPSFSSKQIKKAKKKAKMNQAAFPDDEQPASMAVPEVAYQHSTADTNLEVTNAEAEVILEPYHDLPPVSFVEEPRELPQPSTNVKEPLNPFTVSGPSEYAITSTKRAETLSSHAVNLENSENLEEPHIISNEASARSESKKAEQVTSIGDTQQQPGVELVEPHNLYARDPNNVRSFTTSPSGLDFPDTLAVSELPRVTSKEPNVINQESTASVETPVVTDLGLTALEAGLLTSNASPVVYSGQQTAITPQDTTAPANTQQEEDLWTPETNKKVKKSKKRQRVGLGWTQPDKTEEMISGSKDNPERSSALLGASHELKGPGEEGLSDPTDMVLEPSLVEGAEPQAFKLNKDPVGHTNDGNGSEETFSRSLDGKYSDAVLDPDTASHTQPDIVNETVDLGNANVQTPKEGRHVEDIGKDIDVQEDEWPGGFATKAKTKKEKKQRRNDRTPLEAGFTDGPSTSSTHTEKARGGSVDPSDQAVPQQLDASVQSNAAPIALQNASIVSVVDEPVMPRQDDDFLSYTSTKKGKKGKKSKKQLPSSAWYDETTGSGASTPADAQATRSEPPEADISRDKVEDVLAEPQAQIQARPETTKEVSGEPEAESTWAPASKEKGKKGMKFSKQNQGYGTSGDPTLNVLTAPANKACDTAEGDTIALLQTKNVPSTDERILHGPPPLPPSRPESHMSDAAEKAHTEVDMFRDLAEFEPLPPSRPTSPTALPFESAAHTHLQDKQLRDETSHPNLPALPRSIPDLPTMLTAPQRFTEAQLHDKDTDPEIAEEIQPGLAPRESTPPLHRSSEPLPSTQNDVLSTNLSGPAQRDSFLESSKYSGSRHTPDVEGVGTTEADVYKDISHFNQASRSLDAKTLQQQPAKKDSKKEKRKNKKQKKPFDWAEQEESTTPSTPVTDKELENQDEWTGLPPTTSASRGLEPEQPQQLNIQATHMPNRDSSIASLPEHALEQRIRTPEKLPSGSQFNRDSAVHVSDSPLLQYIAPEYRSVRDSGYQDTVASPTIPSTHEFATGSTIQSPLQEIRRFPTPDRPLTGPDNPHLAENFAPLDRDPGVESIQSSRSPVRISVEVDPSYETSVSKHPRQLRRTSILSGASVDIDWDMPDSPKEIHDTERLSDHTREHDFVLLPQHDDRQPSPVESATKDRSSGLFLSSPSTREDSIDQPITQSPWQGIHDSVEGKSRLSPVDTAKSTGGDIGIVGLPHGPCELSEPYTPAAEQVLNPATSKSLSDTSETPSMSLFGGPVGINSDNPFEGSLPPASLGFNGSERTPLDTIAEHSPEASPLLKKSRALSDIGSPERGIKSMRRSATPRSHGHDDLQPPPALVSGLTPPSPHHHATGPDNSILSTDDFIARLSWPAVDEDNHSVDLDRVKSRNTDRQASNHSNGSARVKDGEIRSTSGQSIRSGGSINRFRTPEKDQIGRPGSGFSNRSGSGTGTPPLRRVDRRLSGDLRAANKRSEAKFLAKQPELGFDVDPHTPSSSIYDPIKDKGKGPVRGMSNVYEGWGDVPGSPLSPTRPPSVRRRQSMQIIDLETKLDQLASENRLLHDAKSNAERGIQELGYTHDRNENATKEALETRDLHLHEKDSEIVKLRETLEWVQKEVARLTEVNAGLAATNLSLSSNQDHRYSQLELEHGTTEQQWQQSTRELEELRQQHAHLSTGMEDIVRHEISIALDDKNAEVRRLRDELEAAKEQVRALQQQILTSKPSDDVLITRDEDYFDSQCQQLCQHVQQWVMRFSKFSDSKPCRLTSEVTDEKITDRFDNAILDGSDVDNYLADRKRRRDVFMSVVMTMVWEFIFTRYLFGMDREQRQKLKSLEKLLGEVGPMKAVHRWRATTLKLLSRREPFQAQRAQDTEAVVQEIFQTLSTFLPPSSQYFKQAKESLRNVMKCAVDLSIEMRTQRAEYIMLPPLQPEYDTNGDLIRKVYFNAAVMNERSGNTSSNEELEAQHAVVRIVLFPLVVKKGDDAGLGDEEIVVCPAQVLVAKPGKEKKVVRVLSGDRMSVDQAAKSVLSFAPSSMDMGNMI